MVTEQMLLSMLSPKHDVFYSALCHLTYLKFFIFILSLSSDKIYTPAWQKQIDL